MENAPMKLGGGGTSGGKDSVKVELTREQAALIFPMLKQLDMATVSTSNPTSGSEVGDLETNSNHYSAAALLTKRKKNSKGSDAQNLLRYTVREAAKAADLWKTAPYLDDISPPKMKTFYDTAISVCPSLKGSQQQLRERLSEALMNRRMYLRSLKRISPTKRRTKRRKMGSLFSTPSTSTPPQDETHGEISPGNDVLVYLEEKKLGKAVFLTKENDIYGKLLLVSNSSSEESDVSLPSPVGEKVYFHQLQKNDIFLWKLSRIKLLQSSQADPDQASSSKRGRKRSCDGASPVQSHTKKNASKSVDSECEYERWIKGNREELKKKLQEIMEMDLPQNDEKSSTSTKKTKTKAPKTSKMKKINQRIPDKQAKKKPSWTYADSDDEGPDIFGNPIIEGKRKCARKLDYKAYC